MVPALCGPSPGLFPTNLIIDDSSFRTSVRIDGTANCRSTATNTSTYILFRACVVWSSSIKLVRLPSASVTVTLYPSTSIPSRLVYAGCCVISSFAGVIISPFCTSTPNLPLLARPLPPTCRDWLAQYFPGHCLYNE
jgi:hypothetical protein